MKTKFGFLFSAFLLSSAITVSAQQSSNPAILSGHFEIDTAVGTVMRHVNVNYTLSPAPFSNVARIMLNSPQRRLLNVDLVNSSGTVITSWTPTTISHHYEHEFDISALPAGSYAMKIRKYNSAGILHTINFTK